MDLNKKKNFFKNLYHQILADEVLGISAQISYYLLLSFFPFFIFLITLLNYTPLAKEESLVRLAIFLPGEAYQMVMAIIEETADARSTTLLSVGMIGTLWVASRGTSTLIRGMNKAYNIEEKRPFWKLIGIGILFTVALAIVILFSLGLLVFGQVIKNLLIDFAGLTYLFNWIWSLFQYIIPIIFIFFTFATVYRFGPNRPLRFKDILWGTVFSTLGWIVASFGFAFYVNNFGNFTRVYGSIGGVIILLLWLYISSMIVLIGAEINAVGDVSMKKRN
jgi:membrane protein